MNVATPQESKPVAEMTAQELKALLAEKEKAERAEKQRKQTQYEKERNHFVEEAVKQAQSFHNQLTAFKLFLLGDGNALHKKMYEVYDKEQK